MISCTVPGSTSTTSASRVIVRSAVGIVSLSDICSPLSKRKIRSTTKAHKSQRFFLSFYRSVFVSLWSPSLRCRSQRNRPFELRDLWFDHCRLAQLDCFRRFEPVARYGDDRQIIRFDSTLRDQLLCYRNGDSSGGFGEDTFSLRQQSDSGDALVVGNVFRPAPTFSDQSGGVIAVGRIADRKRLRDG